MGSELPTGRDHWCHRSVAAAEFSQTGGLHCLSSDANLAVQQVPFEWECDMPILRQATARQVLGMTANVQHMLYCFGTATCFNRKEGLIQQARSLCKAVATDKPLFI